MSRGHNLNHSYVIPSLDLVVVRQGNQNRQQRGEPSFANTLIQKISPNILSTLSEATDAPSGSQKLPARAMNAEPMCAKKLLIRFKTVFPRKPSGRVSCRGTGG